MYLDPKEIIYPDKYDGNQDSGYDIAFIGLDEQNLCSLEKYFNELRIYDIHKKPYL